VTETWKAVCREEWYQMHIFRSLKEAEDFAKWHNRDTGHIVDVEREQHQKKNRWKKERQRNDKCYYPSHTLRFYLDHHGL
jgi:hypothetical protein